MGDHEKELCIGDATDLGAIYIDMSAPQVLFSRGWYNNVTGVIAAVQSTVLPMSGSMKMKVMHWSTDLGVKQIGGGAQDRTPL